MLAAPRHDAATICGEDQCGKVWDGTNGGG
jgi:hypothetical protein